MVLAGCGRYTTSLPPTSAPPSVTPRPPVPTGTASLPIAGSIGELILSMDESGYAHLFAYDPSSATLTRLTYGQWNDITPALSPDGKYLAFASNRSGFWDIYQLDVSSGEVSQITNTPAYDSSPTWSPDMAWIAFETYQDGHLDIAIQSMTDLSQSPVLLTNDAAADHSPAWAPNGREIAYVSNTTGNADVWVADLNKTHDRLTDLSNALRPPKIIPCEVRTALTWLGLQLFRAPATMASMFGMRASLSMPQSGSVTAIGLPGMRTEPNWSAHPTRPISNCSWPIPSTVGPSSCPL